MKTTFRLLSVTLLLLGMASFAQEAPAVSHNAWTSGAPMPTAVAFGAAAPLKNLIYVVGGNDGPGNGAGGIVADTQTYNPATNTWSAGVPYPTAIEQASVAVVKNILYVFGGTSDGTSASNAVWAYNPKTKTWTGKAAMPTARVDSMAVVEKNIVYVIGGYNGSYLSTVESYNPATNTWTEESPLPAANDAGAAGLLGTTIVVTDGTPAFGVITGNTEGYNAINNTWTGLAADPTARFGTCFGSIGPQFYDSGGYVNNGGSATTVNESYKLSKNKWTTTLAAMPQGTMLGASAAYKGQLYCFGGWATWQGTPVNNVQIYQP